ncbi:MAG TPA: hypothetical protein VJG66_01990 [Patescibacteria group bacterium]|nr:hypothetical protein [Patescibacteria group bacterium]
MKLILLHGSLQEAVLNKIGSIKKEFDPLSITEISESNPGFSLSSPSLFSKKWLVILENPDIRIVEKAILEKDPDLTILIKFSKSLEKSSAILKKVLESKGEIFNFEESNQTSIFPLLDLLGNKNKRAFLEFEKNYSEFSGQYILTMLAYFLRRMVQRPKTGSDFMRQKIESQKRNFSPENIKDLYKEIIETDFKIKQGVVEEKLGVTLLVRTILN